MNAGPGVKATVALTRGHPAPERTVNADVRLDPPDAAEDAEWLNATAWQGGGSVVESLEGGRPRRVPHDHADPGVRQLEVHAAAAEGPQGRGPADLHARRPGDPGEGDPGRASASSATFVLDKENLLREQKKGVVPRAHADRLPGRAGDRPRADRVARLGTLPASPGTDRAVASSGTEAPPQTSARPREAALQPDRGRHRSRSSSPRTSRTSATGSTASPRASCARRPPSGTSARRRPGR